MSFTPASSSTARAAPPAITPVPSGAGISSTLPVPNSDLLPHEAWWCPCSGHGHHVLLGIFVGLADGLGNFRGLPHAGAHAAVARRPRRRARRTACCGRPLRSWTPRLTATSRSLNSLTCSSALHACVLPLLEIKSGFAGAGGQFRHTAGIHVATAVENHGLDARIWTARSPRSLPTSLDAPFLVDLVQLALHGRVHGGRG